MVSSYPDSVLGRNTWVTGQRPEKRAVDPLIPHGFFQETEPANGGTQATINAIFLTNQECPWKCLMCDLWRQTLPGRVPPGAIPQQIEYALQRLPAAAWVKLYNSGSFFDPGAIPVADYPAMVDRLAACGKIIVECHPALIGRACLNFQRLWGKPLEIAMGLETVQPGVLEKLNKRMTLGLFARAAEFLRGHGVGLRVFILVKPPFVKTDPEALLWAKKSIDFALACGAGTVSLIPTRLGNGALEALALAGFFSPPRLGTLEAALEYGIGLRRGVVLADLWDLEKFQDCPACFGERKARLLEMNLSQSLLPTVHCSRCESGG